MSTLEVCLKEFEIPPDLILSEAPFALPHIVRIMGRYGMAKLFNKLGFKEGVEVGVETGGYSRWLFTYIKDLHLTCIDPWQAYEGYRDHVTQTQQDTFYAMTKENLRGYNATILREFSMKAVDTFKDESLDFVFVDGNHSFDDVYCDLLWWSKKVRKGGIVSGHDYECRRGKFTGAVVDAVNSFTREYHINPWFALGAYRTRTYMWVKS
jgi:predicted O-methyltransferase YrrM